ncbi:hypothetical protein HDV05_004461 [Chytridiales sp. JEL 0842]|nr:hypothetical protein HDV05_004461 [Chytridiales sp. JEL 0842]
MEATDVKPTDNVDAKPLGFKTDDVENPRQPDEASFDPDDIEMADLSDVQTYVDFIVPKTDDPSTPAFTVRAVVIGTLWGVVLSILSAVMAFRTNGFTVSPNIAALLAYPMGILWSKLPYHPFWNPGPFSIKEHVLIYIMASSSSVAYGIDNVVTQAYPDFIGSKEVNLFNSFLWIVSSQFMGFGLAGLFRNFLVKPAAMWWPGTLSTISLFVSFHDVKTGDEETEQRTRGLKLSRYAFFWICFAGMFTYTFLPEFVMPVLQVVSLLCLFGPKGNTAGGLTDKNLMGSGTSGLGMFSLTFDWQNILSGVITSPFWATCNVMIGYIVFNWIVTPMLFFNDTFGLSRNMTTGDPYPALNAPSLFAGNLNSQTHAPGEFVRPTFFYNTTDYSLNITAYNDVQPILISPYFVASYMTSFLSIAAVVTHVYLWYGPDIVRQTKAMFAQIKDSTEKNDIHCKLMEAYTEIPDWMYLAFLVANFILMIAVSIWTPFKMPVWALFLNVAICFIFTLPSGVISAVSGQWIYLNVITEFVIGLLIPGDTIGVMTFKSLGTNNLIQALTLVSDLKLGHYLHIAPWAMVVTQLWGTLISSVAGLGASWYIMFSTKLIDLDKGDWTANGYKVFYNAGAIWGAIAPARFWGIGSVYAPVMWCFLIGFLSPFVPWAMNKWVFKSKYWHLIVFPILYNAGSPGGFQVYILVPFIVAFVFQVIVFKYRKAWYEKYNYVMGAAFDGSAALAITVVAIFANTNVTFPAWAGNPSSGVFDYYCFDNFNADGLTVEVPEAL